MSRSRWASTEGSAHVSAVIRGTGKRATLGVPIRLEHLLGAASRKTRLLWALAASAAVLALGPAPVLAASGGSGHAQRPATPVKRNSQSQKGTDSAGPAGHLPLARSRMHATVGGHTVALVLAPGGGYDSAGGSRLVRSLQRQLVRAGFSPGPVDGLYGPRTEQAVTGFQAARGLHVDGIAGPVTRAALTASTPALYPGAGYESGGSQPVRQLQRLLARAGDHPGPIDGRYGPQTQRGVRRFQAAHGLPVDGIAQPQTLITLRKQATPHRLVRAHSHRTTSRPQASHQNPTQAPAPANARRTSPRSSSPSLAWLGLLAALVVGLLLVGTRHTHRRSKGRVTVSPAGREHGDPATADAHRADPAMAPEPQGLAVPAESHPAVPLGPQNGRAGTTNGRAHPLNDANEAFNLAVLLEEQKDLDGAEAAYRRADEHGHAAAASNLGVLLEQKGDLAGAETAYRRADERGDANGAFNLAVLLEEQKDLDGAEAAYVRANERGPAEVANTARAALLDLHARSGPNGTDGGDNHVA